MFQLVVRFFHPAQMYHEVKRLNLAQYLQTKHHHKWDPTPWAWLLPLSWMLWKWTSLLVQRLAFQWMAVAPDASCSWDLWTVSLAFMTTEGTLPTVWYYECEEPISPCPSQWNLSLSLEISERDLLYSIRRTERKRQASITNLEQAWLKWTCLAVLPTVKPMGCSGEFSPLSHESHTVAFMVECSPDLRKKPIWMNRIYLFQDSQGDTKNEKSYNIMTPCYRMTNTGFCILPC